jgi:hypothetical protein
MRTKPGFRFQGTGRCRHRLTAVGKGNSAPDGVIIPGLKICSRPLGQWTYVALGLNQMSREGFFAKPDGVRK